MLVRGASEVKIVEPVEELKRCSSTPYTGFGVGGIEKFRVKDDLDDIDAGDIDPALKESVRALRNSRKLIEWTKPGFSGLNNSMPLATFAQHDDKLVEITLPSGEVLYRAWNLNLGESDSRQSSNASASLETPQQSPSAVPTRPSSPRSVDEAGSPRGRRKGVTTLSRGNSNVSASSQSSDGEGSQGGDRKVASGDFEGTVSVDAGGRVNWQLKVSEVVPPTGIQISTESSFRPERPLMKSPTAAAREAIAALREKGGSGYDSTYARISSANARNVLMDNSVQKNDDVRSSIRRLTALHKTDSGLASLPFIKVTGVDDIAQRHDRLKSGKRLTRTSISAPHMVPAAEAIMEGGKPFVATPPQSPRSTLSRVFSRIVKLHEAS